MFIYHTSITNSLNMASTDNLLTTSALCTTCNKSLPINGDHVKCHNCGCKYHYSPCATLSQSTYNIMTAEKKFAWKCPKCRGERSKSPNTLYQTVIHEGQQQVNKQQRDEEYEHNEDQRNFNSKKYKELSLNTVNSNVSELKSEFSLLKASVSKDMYDIKTSIQLLTSSLTESHNTLREEMCNAFSKLNDTMANLASEVSELKKENKEKDIRIQQMENKVNTLEQQTLSKGIEIKNVKNNELTPIDVIKTIAASVNVDLQDNDISNAYKMQKQEKIIIDFCSLNKKRELMAKIVRHRVKGDVIHKNLNENNNSSNNIYINDQLTAHNRRILWLAKVKAKETGWKFVWVKNGNIMIKKTENTAALIISNACDLEHIV